MPAARRGEIEEKLPRRAAADGLGSVAPRTRAPSLAGPIATATAHGVSFAALPMAQI
jgi:hypothetical protein